MAKNEGKLKQIGLTRGKGLFIGVLAIVLVGVIFIQYGSFGTDNVAMPAVDALQSPSAPPPVMTTALPATLTEKALESNLQTALSEVHQTRWQLPELTEVVAYDPFALPAAFPQPPRAVLDPRLAAEGGDDSAAAFTANQLAEAVEQLQTDLEDLQQRGVHVIVGDRGRYVAMIGDRTLHVGDEINGFTVTAIEPDGVRVERKGL
ncbi:MAG: hypothetical protein WD738_17890 [Pirellulales bacterium]